MAKAAAPYVHPRLAAIEHGGAASEKYKAVSAVMEDLGAAMIDRFERKFSTWQLDQIGFAEA
jgi:hypothetical protein